MTAADLPITIDRERIARFCRERGIRTLSLFGSVLRGDFDPLRSDVTCSRSLPLVPFVAWACVISLSLTSSDPSWGTRSTFVHNFIQPFAITSRMQP
jgi:hypothetical protein